MAKHRRLLEQHIRSVHEITVKEFQCGLCEFKAATKMSVDRHMQSHTKVRIENIQLYTVCSRFKIRAIRLRLVTSNDFCCIHDE